MLLDVMNLVVPAVFTAGAASGYAVRFWLDIRKRKADAEENLIYNKDGTFNPKGVVTWFVKNYGSNAEKVAAAVKAMNEGVKPDVPAAPAPEVKA